MNERLSERTFASFLDVLAAKEAVPGGGGAAALAGALGVALCSMVGNFTLGKRAYAEVEPDVRRMLEQARELRHRLVGLVQRDADAFLPLSRAYGMRRDDPTRADVLERATKGALEAPLEIMRAVAASIELLEEMGQKGSRMLLSDIGCGAALARGALEAASLNVFVNTRSLQDRELAESYEREADELLAAYLPRAEALAQDVAARIRA